MENWKSKGPEACFGYRHGYTSIPSPRKPASYYLFVDAVNASIPRSEWMPKRKESSKDEETVDYRGTVACGCSPGGRGRLCGGQHHHLQYGALSNGRGQRL